MRRCRDLHNHHSKSYELPKNRKNRDFPRISAIFVNFRQFPRSWDAYNFSNDGCVDLGNVPIFSKFCALQDGIIGMEFQSRFRVLENRGVQ